MAPDLRDCCQQALLDHWAVCDARPTLSVPCRCGHAEVLHGIRGNGSRGACSISTGAKAEPCGCSAFKADDGPAPVPDQPKQGGQHP